jgi:hypothetical protein
MRRKTSFKPTVVNEDAHTSARGYALISTVTKSDNDLQKPGIVLSNPAVGADR